MSNSIGQIYGKIKNGKSCIKLESEIVDINGIEINSNGSSLVPMSNGMVVQVQHKDYKKTVKKDSTGWTAIDNNLETGFVVPIKPSSSTSNVFVSCNLHVSINTATVVGQHYWGARLYRKIGNGDWTHVIEATGEQTNGTPIWLTDATHENDPNSQYRLINLGNSFLDSPGTTEIVYYTIYWANIYHDTENNKDLLYLNRSTADWATIDDSWNALPISNITAKEIWNSGSIYTPPTTLITTDEINNVVNVTSNLTVANNKVMTVPSLDICGNPLTPNTTYEIITGPAGNINNISFVKKNKTIFQASFPQTELNVVNTTNTPYILGKDYSSVGGVTENNNNGSPPFLWYVQYDVGPSAQGNNGSLVFTSRRSGYYKINVDGTVRDRIQQVPTDYHQFEVYLHRGATETQIAHSRGGEDYVSTGSSAHSFQPLGMNFIYLLQLGDALDIRVTVPRRNHNAGQDDQFHLAAGTITINIMSID